MADVYWNGSVNNTWAAAGNWEDFGGAPYGSIPLHGDDVHFLGARLGANRCGVGPTAVVLLNSIYADLAYDNGVNATVCYANCGMDGRRLATVTIDGDSYVAGGWIMLTTFNHSGARYRGGDTTTLQANDGGLVGGTAGTVYIEGAGMPVRSAINPVAINALYLNGAGSYARKDVPAFTIATAYLNGATSYVDASITITALYMNANDCQIRSGAAYGTVYVYGNACEISLTVIAAGGITTGPYMCDLDQILYDYDTAEVIGDLSQIPSYSAGAW